MLAPTHILIGVTASIISARIFDYKPTGLEFLILLLGSVFPDIDEGGVITKPGDILRGFLPPVLRKLLNFAALIVTKSLRFFTRHRGVTHWLVLPVLCIGLARLYELPKLWWFGLGYATHILADATTRAGVALFGPFSLQAISFSKFKVGSRLEYLLQILLLIVVLYFGFDLLPETTKAGMLVLYEKFF
jgi:inner membrane protein